MGSSLQILDAVDDEDRVVGMVRRGEVLRAGANFRVAHLWLFNHKAELLVQRLAMDRSRHPGCWGSSVAAYVESGETYLEAITRRSREELGFPLEKPVYVGKTSMVDEKSRKFISLFSSCWNGPLSPDEKHIEQVRFLPVADIFRASEEEPWVFTPTFICLMDCFKGRIP